LDLVGVAEGFDFEFGAMPVCVLSRGGVQEAEGLGGEGDGEVVAGGEGVEGVFHAVRQMRTPSGTSRAVNLAWGSS
jgi:hypothetical protein